MPSYDERTPSGWPLPFKSNTLESNILEFDLDKVRREGVVAFITSKGTLDKAHSSIWEKWFEITVCTGMKTR